MILDNSRVLEKLREFFSNPTGFPDLPDYIVALWKWESMDDFKTADELMTPKQHGRIFRTANIQDLQELYYILTQNPKDLRMYQITPERIVFLLEYMGVKA